ncbi:MAG: hypothetical protein WDN03_14050 [Rhizomicrobium sp.]
MADSVSVFSVSAVHYENVERPIFIPAGEGPANRTQHEPVPGLDTDFGPKWSMGATLRFATIGCGLFWTAALVFFVIR